MIERYDRSPAAPDGRLHQEDFAQALGVIGDQKYQRYGGTATLARIAGTLSRFGSSLDVEQLLRMTVLAVCVGNLDMHAKNLSLLHHPDASMALAPAYDVVPLAHQPTDQELGMAIDHEYLHRAVTRAHLIAEGHSWGVSNPEAIVEETLGAVHDATSAEDADPRAYDGLKAQITQFTSNLVAGRPPGDE